MSLERELARATTRVAELEALVARALGETRRSEFVADVNGQLADLEPPQAEPKPARPKTPSSGPRVSRDEAPLVEASKVAAALRQELLEHDREARRRGRPVAGAGLRRLKKLELEQDPERVELAIARAESGSSPSRGQLGHAEHVVQPLARPTSSEPQFQGVVEGPPPAIEAMVQKILAERAAKKAALQAATT